MKRNLPEVPSIQHLLCSQTPWCGDISGHEQHNGMDIRQRAGYPGISERGDRKKKKKKKKKKKSVKKKKKKKKKISPPPPFCTQYVIQKQNKYIKMTGESYLNKRIQYGSKKWYIHIYPTPPLG